MSNSHIPTPETELEMFSAGEIAPDDGQYVIVDKQGEQQDYDPVALDKGEVFPQLKTEGLYYLLIDVDHPASQSHALTVAGPAMNKELPAEDLI